MTLDNLVAIHKLTRHTPDKAAIARLLQAALRNLNDAQIVALSADNRFDAAYKTIMQCAIVGLWAEGYRTSTSQPGHHQTAIQSLPKTIGLPAATVVVLDALRKQRNLGDYAGDPVSEAALQSCLDEASRLLAMTRQWLANNHPDLCD